MLDYLSGSGLDRIQVQIQDTEQPACGEFHQSQTKRFKHKALHRRLKKQKPKIQ